MPSWLALEGPPIGRTGSWLAELSRCDAELCGDDRDDKQRREGSHASQCYCLVIAFSQHTQTCALHNTGRTQPLLTASVALSGCAICKPRYLLVLWWPLSLTCKHVEAACSLCGISGSTEALHLHDSSLRLRSPNTHSNCAHTTHSTTRRTADIR